MKNNKQNNCVSCKHWKNKQAELDYCSSTGICTCFKWKFGTGNYGDVMILDRENRSQGYKGTNRFESEQQTIKPERSRYCFVTEETFGCIHHNKSI